MECDDRKISATTMDNADGADMGRDMVQIEDDGYNPEQLDSSRVGPGQDEEVEYDGDFKAHYECKWSLLISF